MLKTYFIFFAIYFTPIFAQDFVPITFTYPEVLPTVATLIGDSPNIIEAGAFDGNDTVTMAEFWPNGHIYSFEPVPYLYNEAYKKTVKYSNVTLTNKALSDTTKKVNLYLAEVAGQPFQSSSIDTPLLHKTVFPWVDFNRIIRVSTTTIDRFMRKHKIHHIDFFWLDTEGHELTILKDFSKLEETKVIYCEVSFVELRKNQALFGELSDFLATKGFVVAATNFPCQLVEGKVVPTTNAALGDALFIHASLMDKFR